MPASLLWIVFCLAILASCTPSDKNTTAVSIGDNPAAEGFDQLNSDPAAVELADSIMAAMGGRANWDKTRFISWNFFGRRDLVWDKHTGRVRITSPGDSTIYLINVNTGEGRVQVGGKEVTEPDSLRALLEQAKGIWINDSYWLVMPFKLKDSGVTIKYLGEERSDSARYNVLQLTFQNVGNTPDNKYLVYVDLDDNLVKQWAYYKEAEQDTASFVLPWDNYAKYGDILLSADRTGGKGPRQVKVSQEMADEVFNNF